MAPRTGMDEAFELAHQGVSGPAETRIKPLRMEECWVSDAIAGALAALHVCYECGS